MTDHGPSEALDLALRELVRVERRLAELGDRSTSRRFGSADHGRRIAALHGVDRLTDDDAVTVDQLTYLPDGPELVREFLATCREPSRHEPDPGSAAAPDELEVLARR